MDRQPTATHARPWLQTRPSGVSAKITTAQHAAPSASFQITGCRPAIGREPRRLTKSSLAAGAHSPPAPHTRPPHFRPPTRRSFKVISVRRGPATPAPLTLKRIRKQVSGICGSALPVFVPEFRLDPRPLASSRRPHECPRRFAPPPPHTKSAARGHRSAGGRRGPPGKRLRDALPNPTTTRPALPGRRRADPRGGGRRPASPWW